VPSVPSLECLAGALSPKSKGPTLEARSLMYELLGIVRATQPHIGTGMPSSGSTLDHCVLPPVHPPLSLFTT